ncbi:MAG: helix-turn-helix transcriptional regulator [Opitutaceae bacterium]|nr:helix-turn-helix transcriptional regulator [Opitutaceae bacterium]
MKSILLGRRIATRADGKPVGNFVLESLLKSSLVHAEHHQPLRGTRPHTQPGIEIHLTVTGRGVMHVGGRAHVQQPRSGLVLRGSEAHRLETALRPGFHRDVVCFVPEDFRTEAKGLNLLKFDWLPKGGGFPFWLNERDFVRADGLVRSLKFESVVQPHGWRGVVLGALLQLLGLVARSGVQAGGEASGARASRGAMIDQACAEVRANLAEDLSLKRIGDLLGVSEEHLTRTFRRQLGTTFHRYVLAERVNAARDLLRSGKGGSVTEAAFTAGFQSSAHFSRVFKEHTGVTPSEWRDAQM